MAKPSGLAGGMREGCPEVRGAGFQARRGLLSPLPALTSFTPGATPLYPLRRRALGKLIHLESIEKDGWKVDFNSDYPLTVS